MLRSNLFSSVALAVVLAGCGAGALEDGQAGELEEGGSQLTTAEKQLVVDAMNDARTSVASLTASGVSSGAAKNLVSHRDGADAAYGTADDDRFDSYAEVDAVALVGTATLARLLTYAQGLLGVAPATGGGTWDGVAFTAEEAAATLKVCNDATQLQLTGEAGITTTAARNIVASRPLASMDALAAVSQVGTATMAKLKAYAAASAPPARPDLNAMTAEQLDACGGVGPAIAAAIVEYRGRYGALESAEEVRALPTLGWHLIISDAVVEGLRACSSLPGERRYVRGATVSQLLADPAAYAGAEVLLPDVVLTAAISASYSRTIQAFDFAAWGYGDWNAASVPASAKIKLVVEPAPEMYRRDSTAYVAQLATDTKLNRVALQAAFDVVGGVPTLKVRASSAPGRDVIYVDQRWVEAASVASLASLWSRENGVVRKTTGAYVNRIHASLLNVHPAVLWHERTTGAAVNIGQTTECYDCTANAYTVDGQNLFAQYVSAWVAAGKP